MRSFSQTVRDGMTVGQKRLQNTELDDLCDKLQRSSVGARGVLSTQLTDDGPVYHALSVHLSRAMLITRFDDRYAEAKFSKSRVWSKVPEGSTLIFKGTGISL